MSLDELTAATALLTRVDNKYVVPVEALANIVERVDLPVLDIDGRRQFGYESVYFDTPDWVTYLAAARRRRRRCKVRTRTYVESGTCMFELKMKGYRSQIVKERLPYELKDRRVLTDDAQAFLADRVATLTGLTLHAALTTSYRRWTFVDLTNQARVTIDTDLLCVGGTGYGATMPGYAIVETKSANGSCPADRLLWRGGYRPQSLSKYAIGVAALHPDLPSSRWHRVLNRYVRSCEIVDRLP